MENKEDCFANTDKECNALNQKNCCKCKFYRNDLNQEKIEKDIKNYLSIKTLKNEF